MDVKGGDTRRNKRIVVMPPRVGPLALKIGACGNHGFVSSGRKSLWLQSLRLRWLVTREVTRRTSELVYCPWDVSLCFTLYPFIAFFGRIPGRNREIMR